MMLKKILAGAAALYLSGCVSTASVPLDASRLEQSRPESLVTSKRAKPDFAAMTAGKAMFGVIGAVAMISAGNELIRTNDVEDPASYISAELTKSLSETYGITRISAGEATTKSTKPAELAAQYPSGHLLVDVQTINWNFNYFPTDWNSYRVNYSAKLRLIDTRTKQAIAEGFCSNVPENSDQAPSRTQLLANQAERLKQELRVAADKCLEEFQGKIFLVKPSTEVLSQLP